MDNDLIVLFRDEYCVLLNTNDGSQTVVPGPARIVLDPHMTLERKSKKTVLNENQYAVIVSPWDKKTLQYKFGCREVRAGPTEFALYPQEVIEQNEIRRVHVLNQNQSLVCQALKGHAKYQPGTLFKVAGPCRYIPSVVDQVVRVEDAVTIANNSALYVRSLKDGKVRLVLGPCVYSLEVDEERYARTLSYRECSALGIDHSPSIFAFSVALADDECVCVINRETNEQDVILGPCVHLLQPHENIKVMSISAGIPKRENQIVAAKIRIGQDFMNDRFIVRTKDNAVLQLDISYKWCFMVDRSKKTDLFKVFQTEDFIGNACASLASRIREEAAQHDFETFHTRANEMLKNRLFKSYTSILPGLPTVGRLFPENQFYVFDLDIKSLVPIDEEIAQLLNQALKASMKALCAKLEDAAQISAEKEQIHHECELALMRQSVIEAENKNIERDTLEKIRIEGLSEIEQVKARVAAQRSTAEATLDAEIQQMKSQISALGTSPDCPDKALFESTVSQYVKLMGIRAMESSVEKATIIPSGIQFLPQNAFSGY
eukprot:ANDGO_00782.mRNA.1 Major vault protein alpha